MVGEVRPKLVAIKKLAFVTREIGGAVPLGSAFDLSVSDLGPAKAACRSPVGLAGAISMMQALASKGARTSGFEKAVYVIQAGEQDVSKIGVSADPLKRVSDLQGGHYRELTLHAVVFCPTRKSVSIEQGVLAQASEAGTRLKGEWIAASPEAVLDSIFDFAKAECIPICDGRTWFDNLVNRTKALRRNQEALRGKFRSAA